MRKEVLLLVFFISFSGLYSQSSAFYTNQDANLNKALLLYQRQEYASAVTFFEREFQRDLKPIQAEGCQFYIASSLLRLNKESGLLAMENFLLKYPSSIYLGVASLDLANYYFDAKDYENAVKWYASVDNKDVQKGQEDRFNFQRGYSFFETGDKKQAEMFFSAVDKNGVYGQKASYYLGYLAYDKEEYSQAKDIFNTIADEKLTGNISYYQADMDFKEGKFQDAIIEAMEQLSKTTNPQEVSQLNKIVGESYFHQQNYVEALPYLQKYEPENSNFTTTDLYYIGYCYYKQQDYENAISSFNKILEGKDAVSQNAYYHLAECYLLTNRKQEALNAFKNASEMEFSPQIQKDAMLNYAKLSYEIGNHYSSAWQVIEHYLKKYKNSDQEQLRPLLIDSYINSGNYLSVISMLEKTTNKKEKNSYYLACFYRGIQLYQNGSYQEALSFFKKGKNSSESSIKSRSAFWVAEILYNIGDFKQAQDNYKSFILLNNSKNLPEYAESFYGLAYSNFNQRNYFQAIEDFDNYLNLGIENQSRVLDIQIRKADCYFALGKYQQAIAEYDKIVALNDYNSDYAAYQKAQSFGFIGQNDKKIENLFSFAEKYQNSHLREQALFELGNTLVARGDTQSALEVYNQIQKEYENGYYSSKSMLREALVYYNQGENQKALDVYTDITKKYPNTSDAIQAATSAKPVYVDMGKIAEYAQWIKQLGYVDITEAELDNSAFEYAERLYIQDKKSEAILAMESYLKNFPNGISNIKASFYLAQLYFSQSEKQKAKPYYEKVYKSSDVINREQTLTRLSHIYLEELDYKSALPVLKELELKSTIAQNVVYAQSNLMKISYESKDYKEALRYAEILSARESLDTRIRVDANVIMARSYIATSDFKKAEKLYAQIRKNSTGAIMAEAMYYDAFFKHQAGLWNKSNEVIQKIAKDYGGYKEYSAKALILMAKNFNALKDDYQATYILNNVIENFKNYKDIVQEAKKTLEEIKKK